LNAGCLPPPAPAVNPKRKCHCCRGRGARRRHLRYSRRRPGQHKGVASGFRRLA